MDTTSTAIQSNIQNTRSHLRLVQNSTQSIDWNRYDSTLIIEVVRDGKIYTSTAVAIAPNIILTAAHSVDCLTSARVYLGDDYGQRSDDQFIDVKRVSIHPGYNPSKSFYENDVAIVFLNRNLPSEMNLEVLSNLEIKIGDKLERIGFGGRNKKNLKTWTNPIFKGQTFNKKNFILEDNKSVIGDSGGPVFYEDNGVKKLLGLHSTLEGESKTYIVNLSQYSDWIGNFLYSSSMQR